MQSILNISLTIQDWKNLSGIISSFTTIGITLIATIIAYKGYQKAKIGLLSPMKSAVVTKQTDLFIELVNYLKNDFSHDELNLYSEIIFINSYSYLIDCGYIFPDTKLLKDKLRKDTKMSIFNTNLDENKIDEIEVIMPFQARTNNSEDIEKAKSKEKLTNLKNGIVMIQLIKVGASYLKVTDELKKYINNPLVPDKIRLRVIQIQNNILENIHGPLIREIEDYLVKLVSKDLKKEEVNVIGVYNLFNRKRVNQNQNLEVTIKSIREYLHVDDEWT